MKKDHKTIMWFLVSSIVFIISITAIVMINVNKKTEKSNVSIGNKDDRNVSNLIIVLDPGHGNKDSGATNNYGGTVKEEDDLNFKIANFLKEDLLSYVTSSGNPVEVYLTRERDSDNPDLKARVDFAIDKKADLLVSLHNNTASNTDQATGSQVIVTHSYYQPENSELNSIFEIEQALGKSILEELQKLGLKLANGGIISRVSEEGKKYPNGDVADWYEIIRDNVEAGIPSVIVEHAYVDNESDFNNFLSTDEKLKGLAAADAQGIANYYNLSKVGT